MAITWMKYKYRVHKPGNGNSIYRARTGPRCCNDGCASKPDGINWRKETWGVKVTK